MTVYKLCVVYIFCDLGVGSGVYVCGGGRRWTGVDGGGRGRLSGLCNDVTVYFFFFSMELYFLPTEVKLEVFLRAATQRNRNHI